MQKPFVGLIILDGFGLGENKHGNAIYEANPVNLFSYFKNNPFTKLNASSIQVGLPKGQIGNSEVGHLNIGAGRVVYQSLLKINNAINNGTFSKNTAILNAFNHAKKNNSAVHVMGLVSNGGVHSHINHLLELIKMAKANNVEKLYVHCFLDGRDTLRNASPKFISQLKKALIGTNYKIASVIGRLYAMDREKNYSRTELAYNLMVKGESKLKFNNAISAIKYNHEKEIYDEFIEPCLIVENNEPVATIKDNDAVIMFNFREDRMREIAETFLNKKFKHFNVAKFKNLFVTSFVEYDERFKPNAVAFPTEIVKNTLSEVISKSGLRQLKITETTKFAHVTYFINGGIEPVFKKEERVLIPTVKVENFESFPNMRAKEITDEAINKIKSGKFNFMALNYSNCDMIGHTGNLSAAISAVKCLDEEVKKLVDAIIEIGGVAIITADHGNAEQMINEKGQVLTDHTTNKVPFCIINYKNVKLKNSGALCNIAPTILEILNLEKPEEMEDSLINN